MIRINKIFAIISISFLCNSLYAQNSEINCVHYPYNTQVGINLNANLLSKVKIEPLSDYFRSYPSFGADLGVYLYQRVHKWFGIQIGAEYNAITYRCGTTKDFFDFDKKYTGYYSTGFFTFPILFNVSYYFNEKHGIDISLGGAFSLSDGFGGYSVEMPGELGNTNYCWLELLHDSYCNFSLYGKIGYHFLFKNKNTFGMAIVGSYATDAYSKGYYQIGRSVDGTYKIDGGRAYLRNTYIGLQFSYGFTMRKLLCRSCLNKAK